MGTLDRHWKKIVALVVLVSVCALIRHQRRVPPNPSDHDAEIGQSPSVLPSRPPVDPVAKQAKPEVPFEELSEAEQHKRIDIENMTQIHASLMAFKEETGHFPAEVSDLVPDYLDARHLVSPRKGEGYNFEFRNKVFRDGRTWEEIKEVQRMEWGDVIPILRSFNHSDGVVVNMAYGGIPYETQMNWEWDPNTLDAIATLGWGPGLTVGEFTEVSVTNADGQPVDGAAVWASGRHYSFDLPDRPFLTNADGIARIPLGTDLDRTELSLRVKTADGDAAPSVGFPRGAPPEEVDMILAPTQTLSGVLIDDTGELLANTWLYLRNSDASSTLGAVKTDAQGQWKTDLPDADVEGLMAVPAPPGVVARRMPGMRVDTAHALAGEAEIVHRPSEP